jgi:hypothetical protein
MVSSLHLEQSLPFVIRGETFMRLTTIVALALFAARFAAAAEPEPNTLSAEEKEAGWKLLFDGQSTDGWRNYKQDSLSPGWKVEEGVLVRGTERAGDIITKGKYGAFELVLEYNISKGGNSGLMYHVEETSGPPWHTGPEIQIQDNAQGRDPQKSGWLYQLYRPEGDKDAARPAGEWNRLRILITPEKCATWMNGELYYEYVKGSDEWNERVAQSKFARLPNFGKPTSGHICLQDHGNPVSFRNIKIRVMDEK